MRSPLVNVRTWLAVSVYVVIAQAFVALKDGKGLHTGERRFKCGHNIDHTPYALLGSSTSGVNETRTKPSLLRRRARGPSHGRSCGGPPAVLAVVD